MGKVIEGDQFVTTLEGEVIADVPSELLADPPVAKRELRKPELDEEYVDVEDIDPRERITKVIIL